MEIKINVGQSAVYLRGGDNCYELCEMRQIRPEKGAEPKPTLCPYKYFTSLPAALNCLLDMKIRASDAASLTELQNVIKTAKDELSGMYDTGA